MVSASRPSDGPWAELAVPLAGPGEGSGAGLCGAAGAWLDTTSDFEAKSVKPQPFDKILTGPDAVR
ncbi:hypothetical protein GCM10027456_43280 [Kineosporia babensis]